MKSFCLYLALSALTVSLSIAQTRPTTKSTTKPLSTTTSATRSTSTTTSASRSATTVTTTTKATSASTTPTRSTTTAPAAAVSTNPNRRQELYDEYHGISKKPSTTSAPIAQPGPSRPGPSRPNQSRTAERKPADTRPSQPIGSPSTGPVTRQESASPALSSESNSGVRIGLRGGVTYPYNFDPDIAGDPTVSFVGGIVFNVGRGTLSFQPEINYARYAGKATIGQGTVLETTLNGAADQVEVPLFLKIATGTPNSNRFFLNIGPYASYALNISVNGKTQSLNGVEGRFGFGAAAGIGTALKAGPGHLTIEVRGLYSLGDTDAGFNTDSQTIYTQAAIGYMVPLGSR
ncbi:hypothetical protein GGR92_001159 [Spirosoma lacussanchae]|uniref:porin family protein n=1 Tax=Spirosoma lacussanchae TaxID=1884249 RepID=UPI001108A834|nr:porin family protein [Spirosoma lacussanchae]